MENNTNTTHNLLKTARKQTLLKRLSKTKRSYVAYELSDKERRYLEFRFKFPDCSICIPYHQLIDVRCEWRFGAWIDLHFARASSSPLTVKIEGKNLQELYYAILEWKALGIEEYDARVYLPSEKDDAPFVRKIGMDDGKNAPIPSNQIN